MDVHFSCLFSVIGSAGSEPVNLSDSFHPYLYSTSLATYQLHPQ